MRTDHGDGSRFRKWKGILARGSHRPRDSAHRDTGYASSGRGGHHGRRGAAASRLVAIFHVDQVAVSIDDAGQARHTGNSLFLGQAERWIPFSEPVDSVVHVRQFALPERDRVWQKPYLESTLVQQGIRCAEASQTPRWLTDHELRDQVSAVNLTLAPVILSAVTDAVAVALPGRPSLCILRRDGQIACINDDRKLSSKP